MRWQEHHGVTTEIRREIKIRFKSFSRRIFLKTIRWNMTEIDTEPSSPLKGWPLQLLSHFSYFLRSLYNLHVRLTKVKTQPSTPRKSVVACRLGSETFEFDIKEADTSRSDEGLEMSVSLSFHDENLTRQFCPSITASPLFCPPRECLVTGRSISTARYYFQYITHRLVDPSPLGFKYNDGRLGIILDTP